MASGLPIVPRLRALGAKWSQRGIAAQQDYLTAATAPATAERWKAMAMAAAPTFNAVMQDIINRNVWGNAIGVTDPRAFSDGIRAKGGRRVEGMQFAAGKWPIKYAPFAEAIDAVRAMLPPRGAPMSDANIGRFMAIIRAVHEAKVRLQGGGVGAGAGYGGTYPYAMTPGAFASANPGPGGSYMPYGGLPPVTQPPIPMGPQHPQVGAYPGIGYGGY